MLACRRFAPMIGSREGELSSEDALALAEHLGSCPSCRAFAADVEATSSLFADALLRRAASRDFAPFVDEIMVRTGHAARPGAEVGSWLRRRAKALVAIAVPLVAAAAVFMYVRFAHDDGGPPEQQLASLEISTEGGIGAVIPTQDGPVVLLEPDDATGT